MLMFFLAISCIFIALPSAHAQIFRIRCSPGEQVLHTIPGKLTNDNFRCVKLENPSCVQECYKGVRDCHAMTSKRPGTYDADKSLVYITEVYISQSEEWKTCCISRQFVAANCRSSIMYNNRFQDGKNLFNSNPFSISSLNLGPNPAIRFFHSQDHPLLQFSYGLEACSGKLRTGGSYCDPCEKCRNGAVCNPPASYPVSPDAEPECICKPGSTGTYCDVDVDECLSNPCQNYGTCVDLLNGYQCNCTPGFTGVLCDTEVNECDSSPCHNGGTCLDKPNGFTCSCLPGFSGAICDIDLCDPNPCWNSGTCIRSTPLNHQCQCTPLFTGLMCESEVPTTTTIPVTMTTFAKYPFDFDAFLDRVQNTEGGLVSTNWCNPNPCPSGGMCSNVGIGYKCQYHCITMTVYPGNTCDKGTTPAP